MGEKMSGLQKLKPGNWLLMNVLVTKFLAASLAGVSAFLLGSSALAQAGKLPPDPRYSAAADPNWLQGDYLESLRMMGAAQLIHTYNGSGTAIVQFENEVARIDARFGSVQQPGESVFGTCTHVAAATTGRTDATGWVPGGSNCKVAWVMCFAGMRLTDLVSGSPPLTQLERRQTNCSTADPDRAHVTYAATALATVAPGSKIIAIKIEQNSAYAFKKAVEWLLHPSSDSAWYLANGYTQEEAVYYANTFGGRSPAAAWNVVATTASISPLVSPTVASAFSVTCKATPNPDSKIPAPYEYVRDWSAQYQKAKWVLNFERFLGGLGVDAEDAYEANFRAAYVYFEPYISILRDNGVMPFFPSGNILLADTATGSTKAFVTPNGITYPACVGGAFAVSGAKPDYAQYAGNLGAYRRYIGTNSHPTMTDFVVAATGTSSHATPVAAAAVAVLKSSNLAANADVSTIERYLKLGAVRSDLPEIPAGLTCRAERADSSLPFPGGAPHFAHPSLDCPDKEYTLPVLHLGKSIELAVADEAP